MNANSNSDSPGPDTFANRLQRLMETMGFTQTTLAKKSGIERTTINRMLQGTRQPRPFEIGVLAQCFDAESETLMDGVSLPPQVQRAVDYDRARTEQLLAAEAARDEAVARADQLAAELERLRGERDRDQTEARKSQAASDARWTARLRAHEQTLAAEAQTSDTMIRNLKGIIDRAAAKRREDDATRRVLRTQVVALQQQLAHEQSAKASAGVLGGLLGMAIGRAMD